MMNTTKRSSIIVLEPYRICFPLALLIGIIGVSLWPIYYAEALTYYPLAVHSGLMIEGFVGGFAIGFMATAFPKMVGAPALKPWQVYTSISLLIASAISHLFNHVQLGHACFATMMFLFLGAVGIRFFKRTSSPPPGMILSLLGLFSGTLASVFLATASSTSDYKLTLFYQRLLNQAFILLPLLGVGSFMFPMIFNRPSKSSALAGDTPAMSLAWKVKAFQALIVGFILIGTYWAEVHSGFEGLASKQAMSWWRFVICLLWLIIECELISFSRKDGAMAWSLRGGIFCWLGSLVATGIMIQYRIALEHMLYIGGFALISLMVGTRVIYGHSGQADKFNRWTKPIIATVGLLVLCMATRVSADFLPHIRNSHHVYAAICWILVSLIWAIAVLPSVRKKPPVHKPRIKLPTLDSTENKNSLMDMDFRK